MTETPVQQTAGAASRESLMKLRNTAPKMPYDIPGVGRVWVVGLKHIEAKQWHAEMRASSQDPNAPDLYADARLVMRCVRDESGQTLFQSGDEMRIVEFPDAVMQDLLRLCARVNGIGMAADEEIRKNLASLVSGS